MEKPDRDTEHDRLFDATYERLAKKGVCDVPGGAEHARVKAEWVAAARKPFIEPFIRKHANKPPRAR